MLLYFHLYKDITMIIANKTLTINASPLRVWEFIGEAMLTALKLGRFMPIDQNNFIAVMKVKLGFITLPMSVEGRITESNEPTSWTAVIQTKAMGGIIWLKQKASFVLTQVDEDTTEINSKMIAEGMSLPIRVFLLGKVRQVASETLDEFGRLLKQWS